VDRFKGESLPVASATSFLNQLTARRSLHNCESNVETNGTTTSQRSHANLTIRTYGAMLPIDRGVRGAYLTSVSRIKPDVGATSHHQRFVMV
jgi:hypothetical protein